MELYTFTLLVLGLIILLVAFLPEQLQNRLISFPLVMVGLGMLLYSLPLPLPDPDPIAHESLMLHLTELSVIISLIAAGLKINRDITLANFRIPLLMVLVTMIGCIAAVAGATWLVIGLVPSSALLMGAVFAPTDPVIGDEIQVDFAEDQSNPVRFSLTAEAGLNDGMAFPFTWLAVWTAAVGTSSWDWLTEWAMQDVLYRILAGTAGGFIVGRAMAHVLFTLPQKDVILPIRRELVAIAVTLLAYSLIEFIHGYGFIAVFVAGLTLRHFEMEHEFQARMHDFIDQIEKFLLGVLLVLLGGYTVTYMFEYLSWMDMFLVLLFILVIRPLFGYLPLFKSNIPTRERWLIAFLGLKGVGSFYYLAFALHQTEFAGAEHLWAITGFLVLASAVVHGVSLYFIDPLDDLD